ncbi:MAG: hypothetical protein MI923_03600, partial [Phycisphaerales bacterium]|nr:hypothetical protein [Phycisphaerales bacterium]
MQYPEGVRDLHLQHPVEHQERLVEPRHRLRQHRQFQMIVDFLKLAVRILVGKVLQVLRNLVLDVDFGVGAQRNRALIRPGVILVNGDRAFEDQV